MYYILQMAIVSTTQNIFPHYSVLVSYFPTSLHLTNNLMPPNCHACPYQSGCPVYLSVHPEARQLYCPLPLEVRPLASSPTSQGYEEQRHAEIEDQTLKNLLDPKHRLN